MSKIGKSYKRTDELGKKTRSELPVNSLVAIYDVEKEEEFAVDQIEFSQINSTENVIPVRKDGVFKDSPFTVVYESGVATQVVSDVKMTIPSGTLNLGGVLKDDGTVLRGVTELKDSGESFLAADNITGLDHTIPLTLINDDLNALFGAGRTRVQDGKPFVWSIFGGNDNDQVTLSGGRKLIVTFREVLTAFVTAQRLRGTKGKLHYRVIDTTAHDGIDTLVYTSEQGDPIDFDSAVAPDFQVQYETFNPNYLIQDHLLRLEFFSADGGDVILKGMEIGAIPEEGDIHTFIPFFETRFSTTRERVVFPNDEVRVVSSNFSITESIDHAVDTTGGAVTLTANPDLSKTFAITDAKENFSTNNCVVALRIHNTRTTPNDNIGASSGDAILADEIDAGASGVRNLISEGATPKVYHNGTNWQVVTNAETLDFAEVTNRSGLFFFRILGSKCALSVGDQTQAIDNTTGSLVVFDTIGGATDPMDSVRHLRSVMDRSVVFDDEVTGETVTLNKSGESHLFWFKDNEWSTFKKSHPTPTLLYVNSDQDVQDSMSYGVDTSGGAITITVPAGFEGSFTVYDGAQSFNNNACTVDFSAFGQGSAVLQQLRDAYKFYWDGSQWRFVEVDMKTSGVV